MFGCRDMAIAELASQVDGNLLARCLEKPWACSQTLYNHVNQLLRKLEGAYNSDPAVSGALDKCWDSLLHTHALDEFLRITEHEADLALLKGKSQSQVEGILGIYKEVALNLSRQRGVPLSSCYEYFAVSESEILNLNVRIHGTDYVGDHKLQRQLLSRHKTFVIEGHEDLLRWSLAPERNGWTSEFEIDATRVAAYFGHDMLIDIFLQNNLVFRSSKTDRLFAASLGVAEVGRVSALAVCLAELRKRGVSLQLMLSDLSTEYDSLLSEQKECISVLSSSLADCAISYCLSRTEAEALSDHTPHFTTLHWLRDNVNMDVAALVRAASLILGRVSHSVEPYDRLVDALWSITSILTCGVAGRRYA